MIEKKYPNLEINLLRLKENVSYYTNLCANKGIDVAGVIKGTNGITECVKQIEKGGVKQIASSRLEQLYDAKNAGITVPLMLIRIPMLSEVEEVIEVCDISLNSEVRVLEALNNEAGRRGKVHDVILMVDLGDLREGYWDKEEVLEIAKKVEFYFKNLKLLGIGTNVGCFGSIMPTKDKLNELVGIAETIEFAIGRKLKYISGGATSSIMRIFDGDMPERINHLRLGESILLSYDLEHLYHYDMPNINKNVYTLRAEIIELKDKPTYPIGEMGFDAFGHKQNYIDRGIRKRALLGIGKADIGESDTIIPKARGIMIIGGSSDHTILDVEDLDELEVGDIIEFDIKYTALLNLTNSRNIKITFKNE